MTRKRRRLSGKARAAALRNLKKARAAQKRKSSPRRHTVKRRRVKRRSTKRRNTRRSGTLTLRGLKKLCKRVR